MHVTRFSKPIWAIALCFCFMHSGYAANEVGEYSPVSMPQAVVPATVQVNVTQNQNNLYTRGQTEAQSLNFMPYDYLSFDESDVDAALSSGLDCGVEPKQVGYTPTTAWLFDFNNDEQTKPKPSQNQATPQNGNGEPWSEVSSWFKQYSLS